MSRSYRLSLHIKRIPVKILLHSLLCNEGLYLLCAGYSLIEIARYCRVYLSHFPVKMDDILLEYSYYYSCNRHNDRYQKGKLCI